MKVIACVALLFASLLARAEEAASLAGALKTSYESEANGNYAAAIKPLTALSPAGTTQYIVQLRLGWLNYCTTNFPASITHYSQASRLIPTSFEALLGLMLAQQAAGKLDDALRTGQVALREDPNNYTALSRTAWIYYLKKDYRQAVVYYRKLTTRYPTDTEMLLGLGYALQQAGEPKEAQQCFRTVLLLSPGNTRASAVLAEGNSNAQAQPTRH